MLRRWESKYRALAKARRDKIAAGGFAPLALLPSPLSSPKSLSVPKRLPPLGKRFRKSPQQVQKSRAVDNLRATLREESFNRCLKLLAVTARGDGRFFSVVDASAAAAAAAAAAADCTADPCSNLSPRRVGTFLTRKSDERSAAVCTLNSSAWRPKVAHEVYSDLSHNHTILIALVLFALRYISSLLAPLVSCAGFPHSTSLVILSLKRHRKIKMSLDPTVITYYVAFPPSQSRQSSQSTT